MIVLALIIPPAAVAMRVGITFHFWLSIILSLLGFLPGVVHALIVVLGADHVATPAGETPTLKVTDQPTQ